MYFILGNYDIYCNKVNLFAENRFRLKPVLRSSHLQINMPAVLTLDEVQLVTDRLKRISRRWLGLVSRNGFVHNRLKQIQSYEMQRSSQQVQGFNQKLRPSITMFFTFRTLLSYPHNLSLSLHSTTNTCLLCQVIHSLGTLLISLMSI